MTKEFDIAVVGSGAAGIAAAISAARAGCSTLLMDQKPAAGGTGGFSGLTTLCGLYDDEGQMLNNGLAAEFAESLRETAPVHMGRVWVLPYRPDRFREIAYRLIRATSNIQTCWDTKLSAVSMTGNRIASLNGFKLRAVIDCTGSAEVASEIGANCIATDDSTQAPAIIFPLHNVRRELTTAATVAQVMLPLARAGFPPLSFQPSVEADVTVVKFTGNTGQVPRLIDFLRQNVSGFEECTTPSAQFVHARRAGRMIVGKYMLNADDVLSGRKFPDAIARGAWPIEQWDTEGKVRLRYLPQQTYYEIPARCLRAGSVENLFMAGKTISADVDAIASARVMGCCLATGAAAGQLAADWIHSMAKQ
jgi:FAD dependent oxidoreductase/FAD binding domain